MKRAKSDEKIGQKKKSQQDVISTIGNNHAMSSNQESSSAPQIFKLNVDCFEHVFEWLSLSELLQFRRSCKRMKQVADYFLRLNYPKFQRLRISESHRWLEFSRKRPNFCEWIKHLYILASELTAKQTASIKHILNELETLKLSRVKIYGDFYEVVLKFCPRLKYLGVETYELPEAMIGTGNQWLLRQYPSLEHFEIETYIEYNVGIIQCPELLTFFKQNTNIRTFSTDSKFLWRTRHQMLDSNIGFDRLNILYKVMLHFDFNLIYHLVNRLYKKEFFKRLHLIDTNDLFCSHAERISTLENLEKLHLYSIPNKIVWPELKNLRELKMTIGYSTASETLTLIAQNLINLKRIEIQYADLANIIPLVRHAVKLQEICIRKLYTATGEEMKISDFIALHEERKRLIHARKITIYIGEANYLRLKWTAKFNRSLLELKRIESRKGSHLFEWY